MSVVVLLSILCVKSGSRAAHALLYAGPCQPIITLPPLEKHLSPHTYPLLFWHSSLPAGGWDKRGFGGGMLPRGL